MSSAKISLGENIAYFLNLSWSVGTLLETETVLRQLLYSLLKIV